MRFVTTLAVCAVLGATPAAAYTVKNNVECPNIVAEDANPQFRELNLWWLMGYISARNFENDATVGDAVDNNSIYRLALEFCLANPASDWDDAAIHVYERLY